MTTFNAGAIEASLTLGRSNWVRDLKKTKKEIEDLERKTITIGVDLDTDNARVAMDNLELFLDDFDNKTYTPEIDLVIREAMDKLEEFEARLDALDARRVVVEADLDADNALIGLDNLEGIIDVLENDPLTITADTDFEEAYFNLDALEENIDLLDGRQIDINADVDMAAAEAQLTSLAAQVEILDGETIHLDVDVDRDSLESLVGDAGGDGSGGSLGLLKILLYALVALSPLVGVAVGAATAAIVGFAAAASGAAGAVGVLGIGLFGLIKQYKKAKKAGDEMFGPMKDFDDAIKDLTKAWGKFLDQIDDKGFALMADAIDILTAILPTLVPLFNAVADAMSGVLDGIKKWIGSAEYNDMIDFFSGFGVDMLKSFLIIGGNLIRFFGHLFEAIEPFARAMMGGLEGLTASWLDWSRGLDKNQGFQTFMDNALKYGPMVLDLLGSIVAAFINLGRALQPFAGPMLVGLTAFFDVIANMDPQLLTGIIAGLAGLWAGFHILAPIISAVSTALPVLEAALATVSLPVVATVAALAALAYVLYTLWQSNEDFRDGIINTWTKLKETVTPIVEDMVALFKEHWTEIQDWLTETFQAIQDTVAGFVDILTGIINIALNIISFIWEHWGQEIMDVVVAWASLVGNTIKTFFQLLASVFKFFGDLLHGRWGKLWGDLKDIAEKFFGFLNAFWGGVTNLFGKMMTLIGHVLRDGFSAAWGWVKDTASDFFSWIKDKWNDFLGFLGNLPQRISHLTSGMWDGIGNAFKGVINDMIGWWNNLSFSVNIPDKIPGLPDSFTISTPDIPTLAKGAYLTEATLAVAGEAGPEIVAPEPVLEKIVRDNSGANIDYGRMAAAIASAISAVWSKMGSVTAEDLQRLIEAASVNLNIDARSDGDAAGKLASAIGYELRLLGYGGKANV